MVIGSMMVGIGIVMGIAEWMGRKTRDISGINFVDAGVIGVAQALAVVPGVSRSGSHHHRRPVPQYKSGSRGALLIPALDAGHRRGGRQGGV